MTKTITIAQRLKPFSHRPGTSCLIPGTCIVAEIFPALLRFWDISGQHRVKKSEVQLAIKGPLKEFTVQLDLEKESISVWGNTQLGWIRYRIKGAINIIFEKKPEQFQINTTDDFHWKDDTLAVSYANAYETHASKSPASEGVKLETQVIKERLFLGTNKHLNWDKVISRLNCAEILPCWFFLAQTITPFYHSRPIGTNELLQKCQNLLQDKPEIVVENLQSVLSAGFQGILVPQLTDSLYQGILNTFQNPSLESPLYLLSEGAKIIRQLFVKQFPDSLHILPHVPPQFFCGRMTNINCAPYGTLAIEWTKKKLRRMEFYSTYSGSLQLIFPAFLKSYRLRHDLKAKGSTINCDTPIQLVEGASYFFDRFQK